MKVTDLPNSPHTRAQQFAFLRDAADGPPVWRQLCLSLARQAAGLPAVYPSARAAQEATPRDRRVLNVADVRRGMVVYYDNPSDSNPYGHIATAAGWEGSGRDHSNLLVWTNDASGPGRVSLVRASTFTDRWGYSWQFGATVLNGHDLPGYDPTPQAPPRPPPALGEHYDNAIRDVRRALRVHRAHAAKGGPRAARHQVIADALAHDLARMLRKRKRFSGR